MKPLSKGPLQEDRVLRVTIADSCPSMECVTKGIGSIGWDQWPLILTGILAVFVGVMIGKRFLHKVAMTTVQTFTGVLLLGIALALGAGIV